MKCGFGILKTLTTSETYSGFWKNNTKHGCGKQIYSEESYYIGEWENNIQNGFGKIVKSEKEVY